MNPELRSRIQAFGSQLSPAMMQGTQAMFAASFGGMDPATQIERDLRYGEDERNRLDIFRHEGTSGAPVLVFVHGGGFVMGDKRSSETPFYENVGDFAARNGLVGVTITYRLAPASPWPAGAEDVGAAVAWLRANIAQYGGDPDRIFLMGQSAGAVHVASYVAHQRFHAADGAGVAGALMISGVYDVATADANQFHKAYYGEDPAAYAACSSAEGLIASDVPQLFSVSEFDGSDFQKQAAAFVSRHLEARGTYPRMIYLSGHNHLSPVLQIGSPSDTLGQEVLDFIAAHAAR
jgi:triacylglycerol lipase